jgi:hypothetical protein
VVTCPIPTKERRKKNKARKEERLKESMSCITAVVKG